MIDPGIAEYFRSRKTIGVVHDSLSGSDLAYQREILARFNSETIVPIKDELSTTIQSFSDSGIEPILTGANDYARARLLSEFSAPMKTLQLDLDVGIRVVGPNFDDGWHIGAGMPFAETGSLATVQDDPESACGAATVLTSTASETLYVAVNPIGSQKFSWLWADAHRLANRGGIALGAWRIGDPSPAFLRRLTVWSVAGDVLPNSGNVAILPTMPPSVLAGGSGESSIAAVRDITAGPMTFSASVGPATFYMSPGDQFIIWFWLWQVFAGDERGFLAMHSADLTAFTIAASPPLILH